VGTGRKTGVKINYAKTCQALPRTSQKAITSRIHRVVKIVVSDIRQSYRLENLLKAYFDEQRHEEIDTGAAMGNEVW
jgi:hypothetical protein